MRSKTRVVVCVILCAMYCAAVFAQGDEQPTLVVHAGTLLAVPGESPESDQSIIISGNRIVAIEDGFVSPGQAELLDLSGQFVMPGLMDMHVHLTDELSPSSRNDALYLTTSMGALRGAHYARKTLLAGFTTVRDLGANPEAIYALRSAVAQGLVAGPRIFAAGSALSATGGHGDVDGYKSELLDFWTPGTICDGADDCRRATRYAIKHGADWIKITATGGVLSDTATGTDQQMTDAELQTIVSTAHGLGVKVAAHAHGTNGINAALEAGVDSVDHGTFLDRDSIKLFKEKDAYLIPTLSPGAKVPKNMEGNPFFTDAIKAKANAASQASASNFRSAYEAGVKIAFGTDSAVTPHGENADEFVLMHDAGMTAEDALYAATIAAADLLGQSDELGTLEPGKLADLIALPGSPLDDISVMRTVTTVVKDGNVVH